MNNFTIGTSVVVLPSSDGIISHEALKTFSSSAVFEDDIWKLDMLNKETGLEAIYFANIPLQFKVITKEFALQRLMHLVGAKTVSNNVTALKTFLLWFAEQYPQMPLSAVSAGVIDEFRLFLDADPSRAKSSKEGVWTALTAFFRSMKAHPLMPERNAIGKENPFSRTAADRLVAEKYIPEDIAIQFDKVFFGDELPLFLRATYWTCRLIPSRIGEVISLPIDCLRQYGSDYILTLNMFKQNGGYLIPEPRMIRVKYSDMGKFLIDLIKKQQDAAKSIQDKLEKENQGLLFAHQVVHLSQGKTNTTYVPIEKYTTLSGAKFRKWLGVIAARKNILDHRGNPYTLTSHQLRHNAITDRFYEGFELLEIKDMTHHKTTAMIEQSYIHSKTDQIIQLAHTINDEKSEQFAGRVIQNALRYERILKMPRSQRIGHIGVCSDTTGCTNDMFECLACSYFIPNADDLSYFQSELESLREKAVLQQNSPYLLENTQYRIRLHESIVERILALELEEHHE